MTFLVPLTLFGWIPLMLAVFGFCRPRVAVLVAFFGAWLFLPMAGYAIKGFPDYDKFRAATYAALLGVFLFDLNRVTSTRWSAWDLPIVIWTLAAFMSSMSGGFGAYDGVSSVVNVLLGTTAAYLLGRLFTDEAGQRQLAISFVVAGLLYVPLCLYEMRMSPQLHYMVYGMRQHEDFSQTMRLGGWRPMVFMQHGLAVGLFMAAAAVVAIWLWLTKQRKSIAGIPMIICVLVLLVTAVLCKSMFAMGMLLVGVLVLLAVRATWWSVPILVMALAPPLYMAGRVTGILEGQSLLALVEPIAGEQIGSLGSRIRSEEVLIPAAMEHRVWGVGRWISLVEDDFGNRIDAQDTGHEAVPDAMWTITLASRGLVGLGSLALIFLIPVIALVYRSLRAGSAVMKGPAPALAVVLVMHACDNLLNAMYSPVFWMIAGSLAGMLALPKRVTARATTPRIYPRQIRAWS